MSVSPFFNPDDGLTVQALVVDEYRYITGYFDLVDSDYYLDDSPGAFRAEFTCETVNAPQSIMGKLLKIDGVDYRINQIKPDGAGIARLALLTTE